MKALWTGQSSLSTAAMVFFVGGIVVWMISGLIVVDYGDSADPRALYFAVFGARGLFLLFGSVAVWRCARNSQWPRARFRARLLVVLAVVMFLGILAAGMPICCTY